MAIKLKREQKGKAASALKHYLLSEHDVEMGNLQASFVLEFVAKEIGPSIYNQAVRDAQAVLQNAVSDLDVTLHEPG